MLSKLLISESYDRKPAILVEERSSEDLRDKKVQQLSYDLKWHSTTFEKRNDLPSSDSDYRYLIIPVENELEYFKQRVLSIMPQTLISDQEVNLVTDFFDRLKRLYFGLED